MYIVKAEANQIEKIVAMSVRAFETDVNVGGIKGDCPPEYDSVKYWVFVIPLSWISGRSFKVSYDEVEESINQD